MGWGIEWLGIGDWVGRLRWGTGGLALGIGGWVQGWDTGPARGDFVEVSG